MYVRTAIYVYFIIGNMYAAVYVAKQRITLRIASDWGANGMEMVAIPREGDANRWLLSRNTTIVGIECKLWSGS